MALLMHISAQVSGDRRMRMSNSPLMPAESLGSPRPKFLTLFRAVTRHVCARTPHPRTAHVRAPLQHALFPDDKPTLTQIPVFLTQLIGSQNSVPTVFTRPSLSSFRRSCPLAQRPCLRKAACSKTEATVRNN